VVAPQPERVDHGVLHAATARQSYSARALPCYTGPAGTSWDMCCARKCSQDTRRSETLTGADGLVWSGARRRSTLADFQLRCAGYNTRQGETLTGADGPVWSGARRRSTPAWGQCSFIHEDAAPPAPGLGAGRAWQMVHAPPDSSSPGSPAGTSAPYTAERRSTARALAARPPRRSYTIGHFSTRYRPARAADAPSGCARGGAALRPGPRARCPLCARARGQAVHC